MEITVLELERRPDASIQVFKPHISDLAPVVFLIHGGFWKQKYGSDLMAPLALDLAKRGFGVCNLEYRRRGEDESGVWRDTCEDIFTAFKAASSLLWVDQDKIVVIGHSAGGQLALWLNAYCVQEEVRGPVLTIGQAAVSNLTAAAQQQLSNDGDAVQLWLGGEPDEVREAYDFACPTSYNDFSGTIGLAHGMSDDDVPSSMSSQFYEDLGFLGVERHLLLGPGNHYDIINPAHQLWKMQTDLISQILG